MIQDGSRTTKRIGKALRLKLAGAMMGWSGGNYAVEHFHGYLLRHVKALPGVYMMILV